jgi:hypothetical protein
MLVIVQEIMTRVLVSIESGKKSKDKNSFVLLERDESGTVVMTITISRSTSVFASDSAEKAFLSLGENDALGSIVLILILFQTARFGRW